MANVQDEIAEIARLAGIRSEIAGKLTPLQVATVFDAGNVEEMKGVLERYKAASGDQTPSHVFVFAGQIWAATAVVARDWHAAPFTAEDSATVS